jgi:hypothetical protein
MKKCALCAVCGLAQYPLLNPRFRATEADLDEDWDKECLIQGVQEIGDALTFSKFRLLIGWQCRTIARWKQHA